MSDIVIFEIYMLIETEYFLFLQKKYTDFADPKQKNIFDNPSGVFDQF